VSRPAMSCSCRGARYTAFTIRVSSLPSSCYLHPGRRGGPVRGGRLRAAARCTGCSRGAPSGSTSACWACWPSTTPGSRASRRNGFPVPDGSPLPSRELESSRPREPLRGIRAVRHQVRNLREA
jgi:hypothetical protein